MTTRKILISNEYLRLCKKIDNLLDKVNVLYNIDNVSKNVIVDIW